MTLDQLNTRLARYVEHNPKYELIWPATYTKPAVLRCLRCGEDRKIRRDTKHFRCPNCA